MELSYYADNKSDVATTVKAHLPVPILKLTDTEVESLTGMAHGALIAEVHITNGDKVSKFWVSARINKQGRPVLETHTNVGNSRGTKITGSWR